MARRTILLTGATDGIGLALARAYQAQGARLILVGRRPAESLDPALRTQAIYCRVDLAQPYAAALIAQCMQAQQVEHLDLLIHNAALGHYGPTAAQLPDNIRDLLAVNLRAPIALTHALLPLLQANGSASPGKIVCISSVVSALACPQYAVYGASKAALDGFARSLRAELRGSVAVQVIYPGATRTGMHARSGAPPDVIRSERFPSAEQTAAHIVRAIDSPHPEVTIGTGNRLLQLGGRHTASLFDWLLRRRAR